MSTEQNFEHTPKDGDCRRTVSSQDMYALNMRSQDSDDSLYARLRSYCAGDAYPLHMPGHKRAAGHMADPVTFDITEIDGFDNLHHAEGILLNAQQRATALYGAKESFFLVNGSTAGILAAVGACSSMWMGGGNAEAAAEGKARQGAETPVLLMARNCHRSVYHAAYLNRLETEYVYPQNEWIMNGPVLAADIETALACNPRIRMVVITSPTYEGVVSDIKKIAETVHAHGAVLIVDEAHGAHFGMHPDFPDSAVKGGADLVIQSLHKTLPALTQCALLHLCSDRVDADRVRRQLAIYQTSSPSYVLMSSMDSCIRLLEKDGPALFDAFSERLHSFWEQAGALQNIQVRRADDPSRILVCGKNAGLSGKRICDILRDDYHLEMEMEAPDYALAILTIADTQEGFARFLHALQELDEKSAREECIGDAHGGHQEVYADPDGGLQNAADGEPESAAVALACTKREMTIAQAWDAPADSVLLEACAGRICAEFAYLYPPGIPLLVPGERISPQMASRLLLLRNQGYRLQGQDDYRMEKIKVVSYELMS